MITGWVIKWRQEVGWNAIAQIPSAWDHADCFYSTFSTPLKKQFYLECGLPGFADKLDSACNSNIYCTPPKRLVLYFLHAKIMRRVGIVHKSQEEHITKKFSIIYPFEWRMVTLTIPLYYWLHQLKPLSLFIKWKGESGLGIYVQWQIVRVYSTYCRGGGGQVNISGSLTLYLHTTRVKNKQFDNTKLLFWQKMIGNETWKKKVGFNLLPPGSKGRLKTSCDRSVASETSWPTHAKPSPPPCSYP